MRVSHIKAALALGVLTVGLAGGYGVARLFGPSSAPETTGSVPAAPKPVQQAAAEAPAPLPPPPVLAKAPVVQPVEAPCRPGVREPLGVSRIAEIDTAGGPGFGLEQFKTLDFLRDKEIVLTFDDGPWPVNTPAVLKALADQCTKGLFFPIGKHAMWHPEILKQVAAGGHTIGSHTWSHADLGKKQGQDAKDEIEKGFSAVRLAIGAPVAPFFRFPMLKIPQDSIAYLGDRNVAIFSTDVDSWDYKTKKPDDVIKMVMSRLEKKGKGIVLMHDLQKSTATALPALLAQLQAGGYKVVQLKAKDPVKTLPEYDAVVMSEMKGSGTASSAATGGRSVDSIVRTVSDASR